jgi:hypothetical protein
VGSVKGVATVYLADDIKHGRKVAHDPSMN